MFESDMCAEKFLHVHEVTNKHLKNRQQWHEWNVFVLKLLCDLSTIKQTSFFDTILFKINISLKNIYIIFMLKCWHFEIIWLFIKYIFIFIFQSLEYNIFIYSASNAQCKSCWDGPLASLLLLHPCLVHLYKKLDIVFILPKVHIHPQVHILNLLQHMGPSVHLQHAPLEPHVLAPLQVLVLALYPRHLALKMSLHYVVSSQMYLNENNVF